MGDLRRIPIAAAYRQLRDRFRAAGIDSADLDARLLICSAAGLRFEDFVGEPDRPVPSGVMARIESYSRRRLTGEPVARILGVREFWSATIELNEATLVPRPETETLVEAAVGYLRGWAFEDPRIADLGTGSGCILISILKELPRASGIGVDISERALEAARRNATAVGVASRTDFVCGSWTQPLHETFDLVVANPPYIPSGEIASLGPEVALFDPPAALDGGGSGLEAYRAIAGQVSNILKPRGVLMLEVGAGQAGSVLQIMEENGLIPGLSASADGDAVVRNDLIGIERVVACRKL